MAVRSDRDLKNITIVYRTVETGQTVAIGRVVKEGNADKECQHAGAADLDYFGVVVELGPLAGAAGDKVGIALLAGSGIIPVKVGTGGATRGTFAKIVADGVASFTVNTAAAGTLRPVVGKFTQTGVAGDVVGLIPSMTGVRE
jgi:hypothetical protein